MATPHQARILIVDDDVNAIHFLGSILGDTARIEFALDGEEALADIAGNAPDVVLLDAEMPGLDGFATCAAIHALPGCAELPVIFITSRSDMDSETRALELGAVGFLAKPVSPPILRALVRTHLMLKQKSDEVRDMNRMLETRVAERTAQLKATLVTALAADRAKSEFLDNMSHEFRTPLHAILAFAKLGIEKTDTQPELARLARHFQRIHEAGERMHGLVQNLLDVASASRAGQALEFRAGDLRQICQHAIDALADAARAKSIAVYLQGPDEAILLCDTSRIQHVMRILLDNGIRYAPEHTQVQVNIVAEEDRWRLEVRDQGPGIPPGEEEHIFERFVQGSHTRTGAGGVGLGLAICRSIVCQHGGTIVARNQPEGGACLELSLPCAPPSPMDEIPS